MKTKSNQYFIYHYFVVTIIFLSTCMESSDRLPGGSEVLDDILDIAEDSMPYTTDGNNESSDATLSGYDSIAPFTECSPLLFSDDICGHGESVQKKCGTCLSTHGMICIYEEGEGDDYIQTKCICKSKEYVSEEPALGAYYCNWQKHVPGHQSCSTDATCNSSSSSEAEQDDAHCINPANQHYFPFCASKCTAQADCPEGTYCDVAHSIQGTYHEVGSHCLPDGIWSVANTCPGEKYCACDDDDDCIEATTYGIHNGVCIPGYHGSYCVGMYQWCGTDAGCWWGYGDHYMSRTACGYYPIPDPEYPLEIPGKDVCTERMTMLCRPCTNYLDCVHPWLLETGAFPLIMALDECLSYGDAGSFCGNSCWEDGGCPFGFSCIDGQCMSDSGTCGDCPAYHVELGSWTYCHVTNEHGSCEGTRHCATSGLTDCNAPTPAPETCNGIDDNCDGITDEGFPDSDGDGFADCVD